MTPNDLLTMLQHHAINLGEGSAFYHETAHDEWNRPYVLGQFVVIPMGDASPCLLWAPADNVYHLFTVAASITTSGLCDLAYAVDHADGTVHHPLADHVIHEIYSNIDEVSDALREL